MSPRTFTAAVYNHLLRDPDMPATVREWVLTEPDAEQRALYFAVNLAEDFMAPLRPKPDRHDEPDTALRNRLLLLALGRVDWQRVAEALLRHFSLPVILASPARKDPARFTLPVAWKGPVN